MKRVLPKKFILVLLPHKLIGIIDLVEFFHRVFNYDVAIPILQLLDDGVITLILNLVDELVTTVLNEHHIMRLK
jgi:hypothetical protein